MPDRSIFGFGLHLLPGKDAPADASPSDIWQVIRGSETVVDPVTNTDFPGNMILHAPCQIPSSWLAMNPNLTLAAMTLSGQPIRRGAQTAAQRSIALFARPLPTTLTPAPAACISALTPPGKPFPCPFATLWDGMDPQHQASPTGLDMIRIDGRPWLPWVDPDHQVQALHSPRAGGRRRRHHHTWRRSEDDSVDSESVGCHLISWPRGQALLRVS